MPRITDEELLDAAQTGAPHAFQDLRDRHWPTAVAVARLHTPNRQDAEQLAGTAFDQALADTREEGGPDVFLRARLVSVVGRAGAEGPRTAGALTGVFLGLPASWQAVLWHTEVEGLELDRTAELLGLSPAATTALHLEARAGLRAACRRTKLDSPVTPGCEHCAADLGAFANGALPAQRARSVQEHLEDCPRCTADYLHLQDTEAGLRSWVLPVLAGVPLWGAGSQELADLLRSAGRRSAAGSPERAGRDVAGGSLAAVSTSRRGRAVLLGSGALAAAVALAGVAMTTGPGEFGGGSRAGERSAGSAAAPAPSATSSAVPSPGPSSADPGNTEASESWPGTADSGGTGARPSFPVLEPSPVPLAEAPGRTWPEGP